MDKNPISVIIMVNYITLQNVNSTCTMIAPENISTDHAQNIKEMNMWNGNRIVFGESRSKWSLLLKGREWLPYNTKTITGYFNNYDIGGEEWQYSPQQMADGSINLYAASKTVNEIELLTSNSLIEPLQYGNTVVKVEIRARHRTYTATTGTIALRPVFSDGDGDNHILNSINLGAWSEWFDITEDTNAPSTWTWENITDLDCDVELLTLIGPNSAAVAKVETRITYAGLNACSRIQCVKQQGLDGIPIIISGLNNINWDGEWMIKSLGWKLVCENPVHYTWIILMEKT